MGLSGQVVEIRACDLGAADLENLLRQCVDGAAGISAPEGASLCALQEKDPEALVVAFVDGVPAGVCATGLPDDAGICGVRFMGVLPQQRRKGVGRALEVHAVRVVRSHGAKVLRTGSTVSSENISGVAFLTDLGWRPVFGAGLRMWRKLDELPPADLSEGYRMRTYCPGDEAAFVRIKNGAFGAEVGGGRDWTVEDFEKEYLASPYFEPERIFFAECNGELVGTTTAWTAEHEGREVGLIHWVAVMPQHRKKGLGWSLNVQALHRLRELGYREAVLNTSEQLESAVRLYHRLGFQDVVRRAAYEKLL